MAESELKLATRLTRQVEAHLASLDIDLIGKETAKILTRIKQLAADSRLDVRDWEMSESRAEMSRNALTARNRLEELRKQVLRASEHGIFGVVDVVHLSAQIDAIVAGLE